MADPVTLSELKSFARIDTDDDDALVDTLGIAAREFVETATGRTFDEDAPERAKVAIMSVAAFWYEHRGDTDVAPPAHVRRLINQLRDWREPADEEAA